MRPLVATLRFLVCMCLGAGLVVAGLAGGGSASAQSSGDVTITDFAYSSATITIDEGGSITWINAGAVPHSATGDGGEFDTGLIGAGESASITFSTPGTYTYHCSVHPSMVATIIVVAADDGGDDGGDDDPVEELPNTGAGTVDGMTPTVATGLVALALLAMSTGYAMRRRTR